MEASEVHQQEQMDKLGMNVIPCDLRDAYRSAAASHCSTADVYCSTARAARVPRLLPEPRRGSHPRAPRDVEVSTTLIVGSWARKAA